MHLSDDEIQKPESTKIAEDIVAGDQENVTIVDQDQWIEKRKNDQDQDQEKRKKVIEIEAVIIPEEKSQEAGKISKKQCQLIFTKFLTYLWTFRTEIT